MTRLRIRRSTLILCAFFLLTLAVYLLVRPDTVAPVGGSGQTPAGSVTHPASRPAVPTPSATRPSASPSGRHTATATPRHSAAPSATPAPTALGGTPSPPAATPSPTVTPTATPTP
jgi:hypothetical protein